MNVKWKAGDLAFIPAEVMIIKIGESGSVKRYKKTLKPKNVLILKPGSDLNMPSGGDYCEILYNGENWFVKNTDERMSYDCIGDYLQDGTLNGEDFTAYYNDCLTIQRIK